MAPLDAKEIARLRLRSQRMAGGHVTTAEEVVGWLGAVQSQEYELAKWGIGQRAAHLTDKTVEDAVVRSSILRTHILRPTWHFVLPADIRWIMELTAPRVDVQNRQWHQRFGLEEPHFERGLEIVRRALAGGRQLTRRQIETNLNEGGFATDGQRLAYLFIRAERDLLVVSGGTVRGRPTYALAEDRLPAATKFDRDWALAELTRRYFTSHGPAAIGDFTWWSSLTVRDVKRGLAMVGAELEVIEADGVKYWMSVERVGRDEPSPTIHLLQGFDELVVGYRPTRGALNAARLGPRTVLGVPPWLHAVILDGQFIGFWKRVRAKDGFRVEIKPFMEPNRAERAALEAEVARYSKFVGVPVGWTMHPKTSKP